MAEEGVLAVNDELGIPRSELPYGAPRWGGPGGRQVNTSSTRIELAWDVEGSPCLSDEQRALLRDKLANRINSGGVLLLAASEHRSQLQNREAATARLVELVRAALVVPKQRKKTRPGGAAREARLQAKKHRSEVKRRRRPPPDE